MRLMRVELREIAAHHQAHHAIVCDLAARELSGIPPVPQDDDPVRELNDLAEPVRDVEDAHAVFAEILHHLEQALRLALGKARGRFVHDEDAGIR
jgi:hypothetical protein